MTSAKTRIEYLQDTFKGLDIMTQEVVHAKSPTLTEFRTNITLQLPEPIKKEVESSPTKYLNPIYDAKNINEIFGFFDSSGTWSYLKFGLLEHLVEIYGDDELQQRMLQYTTAVEDFQKETTLKVFWKASPTISQCPEIPSKLRASLSQVTGILNPATDTLNDIARLHKALASEYSFPDFIIILKDIAKWSTNWLVPPSTVYHSGR